MGTLGERLRVARRRLGMSQGELGAAVGISQPAISRLEYGGGLPPPDTLARLGGELIDLATGEVLPTRARLERLLDWVAPVADEVGAAAHLALPEQNAAERQYARLAEGATLEELYAEQVGVPVRG